MEDTVNLIKNIIFIRPGGLALLYLGDLGQHSHLVAGYLEAFKSFSAELDDLGDIRSIYLSKFSFSYYCPSSLYFIILLHDSKIPTNEVSRFLEDVYKSFTEMFPDEWIQKWTGNLNEFDPFKPMLKGKIESYTQEWLKLAGLSEVETLEAKSKELFRDPKIFAISTVDSSGKNMQTYVNDSLEDFEIQVFISSPFYSRSLINLLPMLTSVSKLLLEKVGSYYIGRTEKFYLGMKAKDAEFLAIIAQNKEAIIKSIASI